MAHGQAVLPGNKSGSGTLIRIFSPEGEELARFATPHGFITAGIAVDERQGRIYVASDFHHVRMFEWKGPGTPLTETKASVAKKDGGRCAGVSLGKGGMLFTADLAENRVYRFYPAGNYTTYSSFGSGPGEGYQGMNGVRRVFESPKNGNLFVLDQDGVRMFGPTGQFLKRVAEKPTGDGAVLAMGPDGKVLEGDAKSLRLLDPEGSLLKKLTLDVDQILDAALGADGKVCVIPRGEEFCAAAYSGEGKPLWKRGADFDRLTVTLPSASVEAGKPLGANVTLTNGMAALTEAERKIAGGRPQLSTVKAFLRPQSGGAWTLLGEGFVVPAGSKGASQIRFTTAATADEPGLSVDVAVTIK